MLSKKSPITLLLLSAVFLLCACAPEEKPTAVSSVPETSPAQTTAAPTPEPTETTAITVSVDNDEILVYTIDTTLRTDLPTPTAYTATGKAAVWKDASRSDIARYLAAGETVTVVAKVGDTARPYALLDTGEYVLLSLLSEVVPTVTAAPTETTKAPAETTKAPATPKATTAPKATAAPTQTDAPAATTAAPAQTEAPATTVADRVEGTGTDALYTGAMQFRADKGFDSIPRDATLDALAQQRAEALAQAGALDGHAGAPSGHMESLGKVNNTESNGHYLYGHVDSPCNATAIGIGSAIHYYPDGSKFYVTVMEMVHD